ncbi:hypothetical protein DFH28DRAFT_1221049 [Melampsora americana]|nr:hypothetical protein DFH28DRAFT_1221049 [Melampsora americana]
MHPYGDGILSTLRTEYHLLLMAIMNAYRNELEGGVSLQYDNGECYMVHVRNNMAFRILKGNDAEDQVYCLVSRIRYNELNGNNCTIQSDMWIHSGITLSTATGGTRATIVSEFPIPMDHIERALNASCVGLNLDAR